MNTKQMLGTFGIQMDDGVDLTDIMQDFSVKNGLTSSYPAIVEMVCAERIRQEKLRASGKFQWTCATIFPEGPTIQPEAKLAVLAEEFGEVARHVTEQLIDRSRYQPVKMREELVQIAAVCVAWAEAITESGDCDRLPSKHEERDE
jgi:NTP pyrophosphatase (non-canonical NTP hydrolase)